MYNIGGLTIENVDNVRDLGIIVSKDLHSSKHCQTIVKLAGQRMNCILRSFQSRNTKFLIKCFNTFIRTKLEYGSQIWSPYELEDIDLIESIQREFTRRIPAIKKYIKKQKLIKKEFSYPDRLKDLKMESLEIRRIKADLTMVYKMYHKLVNIDFEDFFTIDLYEKTRTNGLKLKTEKHRLGIRKHFFTNRSIKIWNQLPSSVVLAKSLKTFKIELNKIDLIKFTSGRTIGRS
jgi:hypothetical protein